MSEHLNIVTISRLSIKSIDSESHDTQQGLMKGYVTKNFTGSRYNIDIKMFNGSAFQANSPYYRNILEIFNNSKNIIFVFNSTDRFSRNLLEAPKLFNLCNTNNHTIHFVRESLIYTKNCDCFDQITNYISSAWKESKSLSNRQIERNANRKRKMDTSDEEEKSNKKNKISSYQSWKILTYILIDRLNKAHINKIYASTIKNYMIRIIELCPYINRELKDEKIFHITEENILFDNEKNDILNFCQTYDEIAIFFVDFGISNFSTKNEDPYFMPNTISELNKKLEIPYLLRTIKDNQTIQELCNNNNLNNSIMNKIIDINKDSHKGLLPNSKLYTNTQFLLPNDVKIEQEIYKSYTYSFSSNNNNIDYLMKQFYENIKKDEAYLMKVDFLVKSIEPDIDITIFSEDLSSSIETMDLNSYDSDTDSNTDKQEDPYESSVIRPLLISTSDPVHVSDNQWQNQNYEYNNKEVEKNLLLNMLEQKKIEEKLLRLNMSSNIGM